MADLMTPEATRLFRQGKNPLQSDREWLRDRTDLSGYQPIDPDLTSFSSLSGIGILAYRSAEGVWSPVTIGPGLTFVGGVLSIAEEGSITADNNSITADNTAITADHT